MVVAEQIKIVIFVLLIIFILFYPWGKKNPEKEYERGRKKAEEFVASGKSWEQALREVETYSFSDNDPYDKGWRARCKEEV